MILLYNVYLDKGVKHPSLYYRGNYDTYTNVDTFKYTLASVVDIYPWSKVIINVVLHPEFENQKEDLFKYISDLFQNHNLILNNHRCERQEDWKKLYNLLDDNLIYFCCNHDHVFIDHTPDNFKETIEEFKINFSNTEASLYFSHWPEVHNLFLNKKSHSGYGYNSDGSYNLLNSFAYTIGDCADSIQIITKSTYYKWWFTGNFNHKFLPRTDFFGDYIPSIFPKIQAIPYREYFKHFDGYTHIFSNNVDLQSKAANISCPLYIPFDFFQNNIKIRIGYEDTKTNYININLNKNNYTVIDNNGTDLKCFQNEIPYFWKKRISEIDINPEYDENSLFLKRDNAILEPLLCGLFHNSFNNTEVLNKIKKSYNIK